MKVILQFDPCPSKDGQLAAERALRAADLVSVLWNLDQWLRGEIKYGDKNELQPARDKLHELLRDEDLHRIFEGG